MPHLQYSLSGPLELTYTCTCYRRKLKIDTKCQLESLCEPSWIIVARSARESPRTKATIISASSRVSLSVNSIVEAQGTGNAAVRTNSKLFHAHSAVYPQPDQKDVQEREEQDCCCAEPSEPVIMKRRRHTSSPRNCVARHDLAAEQAIMVKVIHC